MKNQYESKLAKLEETFSSQLSKEKNNGEKLLNEEKTKRRKELIDHNIIVEKYQTTIATLESQLKSTPQFEIMEMARKQSSRDEVLASYKKKEEELLLEISLLKEENEAFKKTQQEQEEKEGLIVNVNDVKVDDDQQQVYLKNVIFKFLSQKNDGEDSVSATKLCI